MSAAFVIIPDYGYEPGCEVCGELTVDILCPVGSHCGCCCWCDDDELLEDDEPGRPVETVVVAGDVL